MRTIVWCSLFMIILSVLAVGPTASAAQRGIPASARPHLLKEARAFATQHGDRHPYDIEAILATAARAALVLHPESSGGTCESDPTCANWPVYVIAMRGHFIPCGVAFCDHSVPVAWFEIAAKEPAPAALGSESYLGGRYPDLRKAGLPVLLDPPHAQH
jgi:hypothetical protein